MTEGYHTTLQLKVDWADLDLFGHVNNVAFFRYVQAARVNYCERIGLTSLNEPGKNSFMVASSQCQFRKPLTFPGEITVFTKMDWMKNSSFQFSYKILNDKKELVAEAQDVIVIFDHHHKTKVQISPELKKKIEALENKAFLT